MSDLELRRDELQAKILRIDTQLSQRRYDFEELDVALRKAGEHDQLQEARLAYRSWRGKALTARQHSIAALAEIRAQIKANNMEADETFYRRRYHDLRMAVIKHRQRVFDAGYAPTGVDEELWAVVDDNDAQDRK